jgi:multidrug efflux pump subunit AcrB
LRAYNLTVNDVSRTLQSQNADIPGGRIDQGAQSVTMRTRGRVEAPEGFGDLVLRQVDGHPVQITDVARVEDGEAEATNDGEHQRRSDGAAASAEAVRHEHRRGRSTT